jgi:hypothetical protein
MPVVGEVQELEQETNRSVQDLLVKLSEECAARKWSAADVFKRWDVNSDGDIDVAEFRLGLKEISIHLSPLQYKYVCSVSYTHVTGSNTFHSGVYCEPWIRIRAARLNSVSSTTCWALC